jgi:MbtH protein
MEQRFTVVVCEEELRYSIWPVDRTVPKGWHEIGEPGTRTECLALIDRIWAPHPLGIVQKTP